VSNRLRMALLAALALGMISMIISSDGSGFIPLLPSTEIQREMEIIKQISRQPVQDIEESITSSNQRVFEMLTSSGYSRKEVCEHLLDLLDSMDGDPSTNYRV